jgi:hypothetical protein
MKSVPVGISAVSITSLMPNGTPCRAARRLAIERACLRERAICIRMRPRVHIALACGNALETRGDERLARELSTRDAARGFGGSQFVQ